MAISIDNQFEKLGDDLKGLIKENDSMKVCASFFSIYAFQSLKKELLSLEKFHFIFTDPTFIKGDGNSKEEKYFEISSRNREKSISGSAFEVRLKNELTSKAIAQECAKWIEKKAIFKSNIRNSRIDEFMCVNHKSQGTVYTGVREFSTIGLGYEKDDSLFSMIHKFDDHENTKRYLESFDSLWNDKENIKNITEQVVEYITSLYKENSPELIYYLTLYNIFNEFLEDIREDEIANDKTGFKDSVVWNTLYDFQKDAVLGIINKLERHNGCILADSVGLGKTFTALAVVKYYQERNKSILVLCPKKLSENWNAYKSNYKDNILQADRLNYDVLFHTDLSRDGGVSNGLDLNRVNWSNFDLIVIDESHNFRNNSARKDRETRYSTLMNKVIKSGVKTKVLMLSATPVNNRFTDLKNQLALAYEGETDKIDEKISEDKSIDLILKNAQMIFNEWSKLPIENRTSTELLKRLNSSYDFFKLLDSVTIARSRKHIEKYYSMNEIGKFPKRLKPISIRPELTNISGFISVKEISERLVKLNMSIYSPFDYIFSSKLSYYEEQYDTKVKSGQSSFKQSDRESSLKTLMRINLLKRLESSVESFRLTLEKIIEKIDGTIDAINQFENTGIKGQVDEIEITDYNSDTEVEELLEDSFSIGNKVKISLSDMNTIGWKRDLEMDSSILCELLSEMEKISPKEDLKLQELLTIISNKITNPINEGNKKILVFSAYADTAEYLYRNMATLLYEAYGLQTALITGSGANKATIKMNFDFNNILTNFSPISKNRNELGIKEDNLDILIATDCISEGQNLQDCDYLINYDIHWNPVRIIQRFGRIDRIGSQNDVIQLVNFWPNMNLDDYINLKSRVEARMQMLDISGTGEDNVLTNQSSDIEYRKSQLKKLQEEVVDIEEMNTGISITDLGLNDFRMDLLDYINHNHKLVDMPNGMHSVVHENKEFGIEKGVIYILKNINNHINIDNMNQLHPFYVIYISEAGKVISNHLNVKSTLDILRGICRGQSEPIKSAYKQFNEETNDGKEMKKFSLLLSNCIESILNVKEENDIESLFSTGGTTMLKNDIKGLEDFELISFMVVI